MDHQKNFFLKMINLIKMIEYPLTFRSVPGESNKKCKRLDLDDNILNDLERNGYKQQGVIIDYINIHNSISNISKKLGNNTFEYNGKQYEIPNGRYDVASLFDYFSLWGVQNNLCEIFKPCITLRLLEGCNLVTIKVEKKTKFHPKLTEMLGFDADEIFYPQKIYVAKNPCNMGLDRPIDLILSRPNHTSLERTISMTFQLTVPYGSRMLIKGRNIICYPNCTIYNSQHFEYQFVWSGTNIPVQFDNIEETDEVRIILQLIKEK